ncbi:DNA mismatch repair endonuclease MutL [Pseudogracilibacillus auburnensis]|uniref:DNA mismatch repair protein MutL n=1 Tax=Pseudogracilibacillus auburnensis TaxID=1494959 RepID=A0A2V3VYQ2_9BACI|nr:DNA mismatch repair endonuclease MutL [Pseudogracilibacillus auburnensis]PXW85085.1 DNA mismatch repair protein MutL [Pseudogracilibacillus auburnensis]
MKIRQLPQNLANKIAAGEVVERPASVVKELIENSIDAGSTAIKIELKEAGLTEVKVTDDGEGMSPEDAKRAFLRHATSKIKYDADLFHIKSLGFRGEALASIASVSKLTVKTSLGDEAGTMLYLEAGKMIRESKSDARKGTEITVNELFYNTPARLKYMKTIHTELSHITDLINRYALAHPHIRFDVIHNGKEIFSSRGTGNLLQVISHIYGMQVAKNMYHIKDSTIDFKVEGFIAKPEITRSNRNYVTIIVNGRYIKSQHLLHGIIRAYDTLLPIHRYPVAVLHITLDPILVDVNVHPTKLEVRFSKEKELTLLIEQMIRNQFKQSTLIPKMENKKQQLEKTEQETMSFDHFVQKSPPIYDQPSEIEQVHYTEQIPDVASEENDRSQIFVDTEVIREEANIDKEPQPEYRVPSMYPIGQLQGTYILAQNETGFYMIDQHAAQERIKYEYYKEKLGKPSAHIQQLFLPLTFEFTTNEMIFIEKHIHDLERAGLLLEPFGGQTYAVRAHPSWFPKGLEEEIIRDIVAQVIQDGTISIEKLREEVAILMSCKKSIKANQYITETDMVRLLEDLRKTKDPFTCPHGRPVMIHYTFYEIEKMFKRIM